MAETFTMKETPVNSEILNSDEQDSLAVAESLEGGEQPLLAGKFKDPQALEQAYVELQKKLGEPRDEVQSTEDESESTAPAEEEETSSESEADVETLSEAQAQELMDMVGGDKAYKSMLDWAGDNFSKEEVEMYDGVMESGNPNAIFFAVQALQARYNDAVGSDGQLLTGRGAQNTDDSFKSQAELVAAMSDPRYDRDPAYRADLMRRLENSDVEF
ncbi:MAG: capsid assembly protein [Candidatus Poseidoniaceae archaeon]